MQGHRRSRSLFRTSTDGSTHVPLLSRTGVETSPRAVAPDTQSRLRDGIRAIPLTSALTDPFLGSSNDASAAAAVQKTAKAKEKLSQHQSPHAKWRAPARKPVPALLPLLSSMAIGSSAAPGSRGQARSPRVYAHASPSSSSPSPAPTSPSSTDSLRVPGGSTAARANTRTGHTCLRQRQTQRNPETQNGEERYTGDYVRLVFAQPPTVPVPSPHAEGNEIIGGEENTTRGSRQRASPPPVAEGLKSTSITDVEAAEVLARLPDLSARTTECIPCASITASSPAAPPTASHGRPLQATGPPPPPELWWSTHDGTLSGSQGASHNSRRQQAGKHLARAASQVGQLNLNDTLGRADRAAMVLSMSHPHANLALPVSMKANAEATEEGDDKAMPEKAEDAKHGVFGETTASTLVHGDTMRRLRDTLRDTQRQSSFPRRPTSPFTGSKDTEMVAAGEGVGGVRRRQEGTDARVSITPAAPIDAPLRTRPTAKTMNKSAPDPIGPAGVAPQRTRDALARLYARDATCPKAADTYGWNSPTTTTITTTAPPLTSITYYAASPVAPDSSLGGNVHSVHHLLNAEVLSLAAVQRCFGPVTATHAAARLEQSHSPPRIQENDARRNRATHRHLMSPTSGGVICSSRSSAFSEVSLSSSIFRDVVGTIHIPKRLPAASNALQDVDEMAQGGVNTGQQIHKQEVAHTAGHITPATAAKSKKAKKAAEERRAQQLLYASHLNTTANVVPLQVHAVTGRPPDPLDVDALFTDHVAAKAKKFTRSVRKPVAPHGNFLNPQVTLNTGKGPVSYSNRSHTTDAAKNAAELAVLSPLPDALDTALRARAALLRRCAAADPAQDRRLAKVRQWCDRTQVMICFDNGVCVEQMANGPTERSRGLRAVPTAKPQKAEQGGTRRRRASSSCSWVPQEGPPRSPSVFSHEWSDDNPDGNGSCRSSRCSSAGGWSHHVYVDDPEEAHAQSMALVQLEADAQKRAVALDHHRKRHASVVHELDGAMPNAPTRGWAGEKERSFGVAGTTQDAYRQRGTPVAHFADSQEDLLGTSTSLLSGSVGRATTDTSPFSTTSLLPHGAGSTEGMIRVTPPSVAQGMPVSVPWQSLSPASMTAFSVGAHFRTWGSPLEDSRTGTPVSCGNGRGNEMTKAGVMVQWPGDPAQGGALGSKLLQQLKGHRSPPPAVPPGREEHSKKGRCVVPQVELDLLSYTLTCAGLWSVMSGSDGEDPSAAVQGEGVSFNHPSSCTHMRAQSAKGQQALEAMELLLRDGLGASADEGSSESKPRGRNDVEWAVLLGRVLDGYAAQDAAFLHGLHRLLHRYERRKTDRAEESGQEGSASATPGSSRRDRSASSRESGALSAKSLTVLPLHLFLEGTTTSTRVGGDGGVFPVTVTCDAAELVAALSEKPFLLRWLAEQQRSMQETKTWMDVVSELPGAEQQAWHEAVLQCAAAALNAEPSHSRPPLSTGNLTPDMDSTVTGRLHGASHVSISTPSTLSVVSFECDVRGTLTSSAWRLRTLQRFIQDICTRADTAARTTKLPLSILGGPAPTQSPINKTTVTTEVMSDVFPRIGSTPYIPMADVVRPHYPVNMRNGYVYAALAGEDVEEHIAPQWADTLQQYHDAEQRVLATVTAGGSRRASSRYVPDARRPTTAMTALASALQHRVPLNTLSRLEMRAVGVMAVLWARELRITTFNAHLDTFNAFAQQAQQQWGPLYHSSLRVAYCVCEELARHKMENLAADVLPLMVTVAAFTGCRGGHRELQAKARMLMVELSGRAQEAGLSLYPLMGEQPPQLEQQRIVLSEAAEAARRAPAGARAVVTLLATIEDVVTPLLVAVQLPALRLCTLPALPSTTEEW